MMVQLHDVIAFVHTVAWKSLSLFVLYSTPQLLNPSCSQLRSAPSAVTSKLLLAVVRQQLETSAIGSVAIFSSLVSANCQNAKTRLKMFIACIFVIKMILSDTFYSSLKTLLFSRARVGSDSK